MGVGKYFNVETKNDFQISKLWLGKMHYIDIMYVICGLEQLKWNSNELIEIIGNR